MTPYVMACIWMVVSVCAFVSLAFLTSWQIAVVAYVIMFVNNKLIGLFVKNKIAESKLPF